MALLLLGWSTTHAQTCNELQPAAWGTFAIDLPYQIADFEMYDQQFGDDPRLGVWTAYRHDDVLLNVFIYDYGIVGIPDGVESDVLRDHYDEIKAQVSDAEAYGRVTLQSERRRTIGSGAIPVLEALYLLQQGNDRLISYVFLTAKYGEFIHATLTLPVAKQSEANRIVDSALASLGAVFCAPVRDSDNADAEVLAAIDRMLGAHTVAEADQEFLLITSYAASGNAPVNIVISDEYLELTNDFIIDSYFIAFFLAGAIRFDLKHPELADHASADIPSALRAMISGLELYKTEDPGFSHPFVDKLARLDQQGALEEFVRSKARNLP